MRDVCNQFDDRRERDPQDAIPYDTRNEWSPFFGLSRRIESRADLCNLSGFSDLETDDGVPMPFLNSYVHDGCKEEWPEWEEHCTSGNVGSHCICYAEVFPRHSEWMGPDQPELIALWQELPWPEEIEPGSEPDLPEIQEPD